MSSYVSYNNNKFIEFPDIIFLGKRDVVRKDHLYWTDNGELALVASVGGRLFTVLADDYYKEAGCDSNNYLNPYLSHSELNDAKYTKVRAYIDEMKKSINTIRTDRATIDLSKEYLVSYDMIRRGTTDRRSYWAYRVTYKNSPTPSYVSVAAINAKNATVARHCIRVISEAKPGSLLMSSCRLLKKGTYTVDKEYTPEGCNKINKGAYMFIELWEETLSKYLAGAPQKPACETPEKAIAKCEINPIVFPDVVVYNAPGVRNSYRIEKRRICQVSANNNDVYLSAFDHKGTYLGVIGASERFSKDMEIQNIDSTCVLDPRDPDLSEEFLKNASKYAFEHALECDNIYAGDAIIHLDEHFNVVVGSCKRKVDAHRVSFEGSNKYSFIAASAVKGNIYAACYHVKLAATSPVGSYITSSHAVIPEGEYTVEFDHLESSPSPLADWVIKTTTLDTKKEEFKKAVEDFKDGKIDEVPGLEYIPGTDTTVSIITSQDTSYITDGVYSYIAPRLDNLQEKLGVAIAVGSSNDEKIEKLYTLIDENETTATNSLERVTEIQESLEDFKDRVNDKLSCIVSNQNTINDNTRRCLESISEGSHKALETYQEEINKRFDTMSDKFGSLGAGHSMMLEVLHKTNKSVDAVKAGTTENRTAIQGIIDVFDETLNALDKESAEVKDRQLSIESGVSTLMGAVQSVIEYQERILQNQERKGFWNWLKSLFKK